MTNYRFTSYVRGSLEIIVFIDFRTMHNLQSMLFLNNFYI